MSKPVVLHDGTGVIARSPSEGILLAFGSTVPTGAGYAPGCRFTKTNGTTRATIDYINVGTKASASFVQVGLTAMISVVCLYGEALALDGAFFTADRAYQLQSLICRPLVAGTDAGAVTGQIRKAASGVASASGTVVHSGTINLKGTIDTNQVITLNTGASILLASGDSLCLDVTGVTTAARGIVTALLLPV